MQPSYTAFVFVAAMSMALAAELRKPSLNAHRELARHLRRRRAVADLKENLDDLRDNLKTLQKRTCAIGINSHHCALANLNDVMASKEWLGSGFSPGKRSANGGDVLSDSERAQIQGTMERILDQMQNVENLRRFTDAIGAGMNRARRTCRFSLGGRCFTNDMASLVDQTGYLGSASSPGRKRRSPEANAVRTGSEEMLGDSDILDSLASA